MRESGRERETSRGRGKDAEKTREEPASLVGQDFPKRASLAARAAPTRNERERERIMPGTTSTSSSTGVKGNVRVVVCGDAGTGKTSLIIAAATDSFNSGSSFDTAFTTNREGTQPPVLPPTRLPADLLPDLVPVIVADTSSSYEWRDDLEKDLEKADVIVVCYKCGDKKSLQRVGTYWLPELRHMQVTAEKPVLLVGCKEDLVQQTSSDSAASKGAVDEERPKQLESKEDAEVTMLAMEQQLALLIDQWKEVEVCLQCSAKKLSNVIEVFSHAQKAVMHPTGPLYDAANGQLKPACVRALKRIFQICDADQDGYLSNQELNHFQTTCFNTPLQPEELEGVRKVVSMKISEGIHDKGITLKGFVYLHALFVARGRMDTTWTVLRKFGYDNTLHLREDLVQSALHAICHNKQADQVIELSDRGRRLFRTTFLAFDKDKDGVLSESELEEVFSTSPETPAGWQREAYVGQVETGVSSSGEGLEGLTLKGFLSLWDLTTVRDPRTTLMYALYLGTKEDQIGNLIQVSRRRRHEVKRGRSAKQAVLTRSVLNCFVFSTRRNQASAKAASSASVLLSDASVTRVHRVETAEGAEKTLILRQLFFDAAKEGQEGQEVPPAEVLATCDVGVFTFGRERSELKEAVALMKRVERAGNGLLPCVLACVSNKADEGVLGLANAVAQELGMVNPLESEEEAAAVLAKLCQAGVHPFSSIPQTEDRLAKEAYDLMVRRLTTGLVLTVSAVSVGMICAKLYMSSVSETAQEGGSGSGSGSDAPSK